MKKVLVVLLALTMVFGCFTFASAGTFTDVAADNTYANAIEVMAGLGVMKGDAGTTNFRPEGTLKRAEACAVILRLLGWEDFAKAQTATPFTDVASSQWYSGYVAWAASMGLVEGDGNGTFRPEAPVTDAEWLTIIMRALGYQAAKLPGSWPINFIARAAASDVKLISSSAIKNVPISRGAMAQLAFDALTQPQATYNPTTGAQNPIEGDEPAYFLGLLGVSEGQDDYYVGVEEVEEYPILASYLGMTGTTYEKSNKIVAFVPDDLVRVQGVFTDAATDSIKVSSTLTYTINSASTPEYIINAGDASSQSLDGLTVVAYGTLGTGSKAKELTVVSYNAWVADGTYQLDDTDDIEAVLEEDEDMSALTVIDSYKLPYVEDEDEETKLYDASKVTFVGVKALGDLKEDDVVTVYATEDDVITKIEVSRKAVSGKVTQIVDNADKDGNSKVVLGGTVYTVDAAFSADAAAADDNAMFVGEEGTAYFDYAGNFFAWAETPASVAETNLYIVAIAPWKVDTNTATAAAPGTKGTKYYVSLYCINDGKTAVYECTKDAAFTGDTANVNVGEIYTIGKNSSGLINDFTDAETANKVYAAGSIDKYNRMMDGETTLALLTANTVILASGEDDGELVITKKALADVALVDDNGDPVVLDGVYAKDTNGNITYLVLDAANEDNWAVEKKEDWAYFTSETYYTLIGNNVTQVIDAVVNGKAGTYAFDDDYTIDEYDTNAIYAITLKDGKISDVDTLGDSTAEFAKVAEVYSNGLLKLGTDYVGVDAEKAVVYVASFKNGEISAIAKTTYAAIAKNDYVSLNNENGVIFLVKAADYAAKANEDAIAAFGFGGLN